MPGGPPVSTELAGVGILMQQVQPPSPSSFPSCNTPLWPFLFFPRNGNQRLSGQAERRLWSPRGFSGCVPAAFC